MKTGLRSPITWCQEPHKRGCISKRISKNFLEIFLEIAMPYGVRIFWGSNKKEPKTLVNTGFPASFILRYRLLKFLNFRIVIVPWKPFGGNPTRVRIPFPPPRSAVVHDTMGYRTFLFFCRRSPYIKRFSEYGGCKSLQCSDFPILPKVRCWFLLCTPLWEKSKSR